MNKLFDLLSRFFRRIADFFEGMKSRPKEKLPNLSNVSTTIRLQALLAKDSLTEEETKELAELASKFEGDVIVLNSPIHAATEGL